MPDPPEDHGDLVAMGHWVADCLDERDQLVFRTVVRTLVEEVEGQQAVLDTLSEADLRRAAKFVYASDRDHADRLEAAADAVGALEADARCSACNGTGLVASDSAIPDFCDCAEGRRGRAAFDARVAGLTPGALEADDATE